MGGVVLAGTSLVPLKSRVTADEAPLYGYSAESSRAERQWEEKMRAIPDPKNLRAYMERLSARPHNVGSPYDKDNAEWLLSKFREFGLDAQIESFSVLYPTPKERLVELVDGGVFDNQGVDALLEAPACTHIICSDASRQLEDSRTLLIALADHGGGGTVSTDHESDHPADRSIPIMCAGCGLGPGDLLDDARLVDIPATVLAALGVAIPSSYDGRPLLALQRDVVAAA